MRTSLVLTKLLHTAESTVQVTLMFDDDVDKYTDKNHRKQTTVKKVQKVQFLVGVT